MPSTQLFTHLLGMENVRVLGSEFDDKSLILDVQPTFTHHYCAYCGQEGKLYDQHERRWLHVNVAGVRCMLRYPLRRVHCPSCGLKVEAVPWALVDSCFTHPLEELTLIMAQRISKSAAVFSMGIARSSVGRILDRLVGRYDQEHEASFENLRRIRIDALGYRGGKLHITVVTNIDTNRPIWAGDRRGSETLKKFFREIGHIRAAALEVIEIDMLGEFREALFEWAPRAHVTSNRFHAQALVHDAIEQMRRSAMTLAPERKHEIVLENLSYAVRCSPFELQPRDLRELDAVQTISAPLYRAYLLKDRLAAVFDNASTDERHGLLLDWLCRVEDEDESLVRAAKPLDRAAKPLVHAANTLAKYLDTITTDADPQPSPVIVRKRRRRRHVVRDNPSGVWLV